MSRWIGWTGGGPKQNTPTALIPLGGAFLCRVEMAKL